MLLHLRAFISSRPARAGGLIFAGSGIVFGSWAALIPYIKDKFSLDEAQLGLLLLSMPIGILVVNPISVMLIRRWGAMHVALFFAAFTAFAFTLPVTLPYIPLVVAGLVISGASFGITNVSMNTFASSLEEKGGIRLISSCHGMWSLGAMFGALLSGFSLNWFRQCCSEIAAPQILYVCVQASFVILISFLIYQQLSSMHDTSKIAQQKIQWRTMKPGKELWVIISICLCTYLVEGTITDWSSVYLRDVTGAPEHIAGRGFAVYALFMAAGRFLGDDMMAKYGSLQVLRGGGVLSVIGLLVVIISNTHLVAMPGFALIGAGISLASPILYQASAKVKGLAPGVGLATMNTFAMTAFLGGPVLIGFMAQLSSLRISFIFVLMTAMLWIIQTSIMIRNQAVKKLP